MIPLLSCVVPCHNEEETVSSVVSGILAASGAVARELEIVVVDDGSQDSTAAVCAQLVAEHPQVRFLSFSRNFGKEAAMLAGLRVAKGDAVLILDGDLQHPPALIPRLVERYEAGFDQVLARRTRSGDPFLRACVSRMYYALVGTLMDVTIQDGVGDFRLMSRRAVDAVLSLSEKNRFSKGLFAWVGFPSAVVEYANVARVAGASSWSPSALINYGIEGVLSFNTKPLRLAIHLGLVAFGLFVVYVFWLLVMWFYRGIDMPGYITTIAAMVGIGGIQLLFLGVIGEYVGRIFNEVKNRPHYIIATDTGAFPARGVDGPEEDQC